MPSSLQPSWPRLAKPVSVLVSPSLAETLRPMAEVRGWGMTRMNLTLTDFPTACDRGAARVPVLEVERSRPPGSHGEACAPLLLLWMDDHSRHVPGLGEHSLRGPHPCWGSSRVALPQCCLARAKRDRSVSHPGPPPRGKQRMLGNSCRQEEQYSPSGSSGLH